MAVGIRRTGSPTAFWDGSTTYNATSNPGGGVSVDSNGVSAVSRIPMGLDQVSIIVFASAATTITVESAHYGGVDKYGNEPDASVPPDKTKFYPVYYVNGPPAIIQLTLAATISPTTAGYAAVISVPDWVQSWIRLRTSLTATITAGWEGVPQ